MLLALWPALIAMPETANYALLDQRKRDERRLAAKKKQIADELAARRQNVSTNDDTTDGFMVNPRDAILGNIRAGSTSNGLLGYDASGMRDGQRLPSISGTSLTEINTESLGIDKAMRRRQEELFILLASL